MILAGGSPVATMWAGYELVERYGVRYLLGGDVYPEPGFVIVMPTTPPCSTMVS